MFKDEYNDLFANGFRIRVTAQAVDVAKFESDGGGDAAISIGEDMEKIKEIFNGEFTS